MGSHTRRFSHVARSLSLRVAFVFLLLAPLPTFAQEVWNATDWTLYDTITIDSSVIDDDLTNFPVYVDLSDLSSQFWSTTPSASTTVGTDIRVTTASNTELPRELVFASSTLQTGELHFEADSISSTTDTVFKIWYNGTTTGDYATTSTYGAQNVWGDYVGVWHMQQNPSGVDVVLDSTENAFHGTGGSTMDSSDSVAGKFGNAIDFDGVTNDYVDVGSDTKLDNMPTYTMCTWYEHDSFAGNPYPSLIDKSANGALTDGNKLYIANNGDFAAWTIEQTYNQNAASVDDSGWQYLCGAWAGSNATTSLKTYKNGVEIAGDTLDFGAAVDDSANNLIFGRASGTSAGLTELDGRMDEIRISTTTRSSAWISAEYTNQSTTTDFYSTGAVSTISLSGRLYDQAGTVLTDVKTVKAAVGTSTPGVFETNTDGSGDFEFSGIVAAELGDWSTTSVPVTQQWGGVVYGNGRFIASSRDDTDPVILYSDDGVNWSTTTNPGCYSAFGYGRGKFVCATDEITAYSYDGLNWTTSTSPESNEWLSIAYGNGRFVAVASEGTNRVMYSDDGINWTVTTAAAQNFWGSVRFGNGRFVAVSSNGTNRVMYSDDGINWISASAPQQNAWFALAFGEGRFVSLSRNGTNRVMYSDDGVNWTLADAAEQNDWYTVGYVNGSFVAVSDTGTNRLMTSNDGGEMWVLGSVPGDATDFFPNGFAEGKGRAVIVAGVGTDRILYSESGFGENTPISVWVDGAGTTTGTTYFAGATTSVSDIPLIDNTVVALNVNNATTATPVNLQDMIFFDYSDDLDVLYDATTTSTTTIERNFIVASGTVKTDGVTVVRGDFINNATTSVQGGILELHGDFAQNGVFENYGTLNLGPVESWSMGSDAFVGSSSPLGAMNAMWFKSDGTKLFIAESDGGTPTVNEFVLTTPWDVSSASSTGASIATDDAFTLLFAGDGSVFYTDAAGAGSHLVRYDLSTPWDLSTAVANPDSYIFSDGSNVYGTRFSGDGQRLYLASRFNPTGVWTYELSEPWIISTSTITLVESYSGLIATEEGNLEAIDFKYDGSVLYVHGRDDNCTHEFPLSIPWEVSTTSVSDIETRLCVAPETGGGVTVRDIFMRPDGSQAFVLDGTGNDILTYDLLKVPQGVSGTLSGNSALGAVSLPGRSFTTFTENASTTDLTLGSTATLTAAKPLSISGNVNNIGTLNGVGGTVFFTGTSTLSGDLSGDSTLHNVIVSGVVNASTSLDAHDVSVASGGSLQLDNQLLTVSGDYANSGSFTQTASVLQVGPGEGWTFATTTAVYSTSTNGGNGLGFSSDGRKFYVTQSSNDNMYEHTLSTPWDISTAVQTDTYSSTGAQIWNVVFTPDGTRLYTSDASGAIYQHDMSTPWDLATALNVQITVDPPEFSGHRALEFSRDGSQLYVVAQNNIITYDLSEPWEISSSSLNYVEQYYVGGVESDTNGMTFKSDGTEMYIAGRGNDDVRSFSLATPWEVSTSSVSYNGIELDIISDTPAVRDIFFKPDGTRFYAIDNGGDVSMYIFEEETQNLTGTMIGTDALGEVVVENASTTTFSNNASTTGLTISASSSVVAPSLLTMGDFTNSGSFDNNGGTMYANGAGTFELQRMQVVGSTSLSLGGSASGFYISPNDAHGYGVSPAADRITWYEFTVPGDISTASSSGTLTVTDVEEIFLSPDGTRLYTGFTTSNYVSEYSLSTAWDITTASFVASTTLTELTDTEEQIEIRPDGSELFAFDSSQIMGRYAFETPWDITTLSLVATGTPGGEMLNTHFNLTGDKLIALTAGDGFREYTMDEPWDVSTLTQVAFLYHDVVHQGESFSFYGSDFNGLQDTFYILASNQVLWQYDIPATFSGNLTGANALNNLVTTADYSVLLDTASTSDVTVGAGTVLETPTTDMSVAGSLTVNGRLETTNRRNGLYLTGSGEVISGNLVGTSSLPTLFVIGSYTISDTASTSEISIASGGSLTAPNTTLSIDGSFTNNGSFLANGGEVVFGTPQPSVNDYQYIGSLDFSTHDGTVEGVAISEDGTQLYVTGSGNNRLYWTTLGTAFDVTTAGAMSSTSLSAWIGAAREMYISPDGTRLFIQDSSDILEFSLSPAWDASSLAFVASTTWSGITSFTFSQDGAKFYWTRFSASDVYEETLSTPWDLSTASEIFINGAGGQLGLAYGAAVSPDGSRYFLQARDGTVLEVMMDEPYSIESFDRTPNIVDFSQSDRSNSISLSVDGKYLLAANYDDGEIDQFQLLTDPVATGTMTGANAFSNLTIESGLPFTFGEAASTTGTLTVQNTGSTSITFQAGATSTFQNFVVQGASASERVSLLSSASGTEWYLDIPGTHDIDYVFVQDSNASLVSGGVDSINTTDGGNNTNWNFFSFGEYYTISGTLYENDGVTPVGAGKLIVAGVATSTPGTFSATTNASSSYTIEVTATSSIGTWTAGTLPTTGSNQWSSIDYGNGVFMAPEANGPAVVSPDGENWTAVGEIGQFNGWRGIAYGNGRWVTVTSDLAGVSFDNGQTWATSTVLGGDDNWRDLTYGNGLFVAVGSGNGTDVVMTSPDGITWTSRRISGVFEGWQGIDYVGGLFIAGSDSGTNRLMTSPDGITWTVQSIDGNNDEWIDFAYGNGVYVAVSSDFIDFVATSSDAVTWATTSVGVVGAQWADVEFVNGQFVVVGTFGATLSAVSTDGSSWALKSAVGDNDEWYGMVYGAGRLVAVGENGDRVMYADAGFGENTPITLFVDENATTSSTTATTLTTGKNASEMMTGLNADLIADALLIQKDTGDNAMLLSDADFYDYTDDTDILFLATTSTTTVNADLRIASGTTVFAPQYLVIDGDFANYGTLYAERGEVIANAVWGDVSNARFTGVRRGANDAAARGVTFGKNGLKLYTAGDNQDEVNEFDLAVPYRIETGSFVQATSSLGNSPGVREVAFRTDGTKMFTVAQSDNNIVEYILGTPWDVSTAVFNATTSISSEETQPNALAFSTDGTKMFVAGASGDDVNEYTLSIPWDITSKTFVDAFDSGLQGNSPNGITFNDEGTRMVVLSGQLESLFSYTLSTPWDISSASYDNISIDVSSESAAFHGIDISADGSVMILVQDNTDEVLEYELTGGQRFIGNFSATSSLWDFTISDTATVSPAATTEVDNDYHVGGSAAGPYAGLIELTSTSTLSGTGNHGFVEVQGVASSTETEATFTDLTIASGGDFTAPAYGTLTITGDFDPSAGSFDVATATTYFGGQGTYHLDLSYVTSISVSTDAPFARDIAFSPDGILMFVGDTDGVDELVAYTLSTPWDITTATYQTAFALVDGNDSVDGIYFKPDGTRFYSADNDAEEIFEYALTKAWDVTSASFVASTSVNVELASLRDMYIKPDGTRLFAVDRFSTVYQYDLTTPWDITSAVYDDTSPGLMSEIRGAEFTPDGRFMVLSDDNANDINVYSLSTPWDVTTASLVSNHDLSAYTSDSHGITFSSDGGYFYTVGANLDERVTQFDVATLISTSTGANALSDIVFNASGTSAFAGNASTSDFFVSSNATVTAPTLLTVAGDFENLGTYNGSSSDTTFTGDAGFGFGNAISGNSTSSLTSGFVGIGVSEDGTKLLTAGYYDKSVYEYSFGTPYDLTTLAFVDSTTLTTGSNANVNGLISENGEHVYLFDINFTDTIEVWQFTSATPFDVGTLTLTGSTSLTMPSNNLSPALSPDGHHLYVTTGADNTGLWQFFLPNAYDISSATFVASTTFPTSGDNTMEISPQGHFLISSRGVYQFGTPYQVDTLQFVDAYDEVSFSALDFVDGGARLFVGDSSTITEYENTAMIAGTLTGSSQLGAAQLDGNFWVVNEFDFDDVVLQNGTTSVFAQGTTTDLFISSGGEWISPSSSMAVTGDLTNNGTFSHSRGSMRLAGGSGNVNGSFTSRSAFYDVVTDGSYSITNPASTTNLTIETGGQLTAPTLLSVDGDYQNDGSFVANSGTLVADNSAFDIASGVYGGESTTTDFFLDNPVSIAFNDDGTKVFVGLTGTASDPVRAYVLLEPYNLTTMQVSVEVDLAAEDNTLNAIEFNNDGSKYFVSGGTADTVYAYDLPSNFTISGAVYNSESADLSGQITILDSFRFSADGTQLFALDISGDDTIYTYDLEDSFDLSTTTYANASTSFSFGIHDFIFSDDGTQLFFLTFSAEVLEYALSTPFDLASAVPTGDLLSLGSVSPNARALTFNSTGDKLVVVDSQSDTLFAYDLRSTQTFSGSLTGASAFNNLTQSGNLPLAFATSASTTGTFTIASSSANNGATTTIFQAGASYTFQNIDWQGSSSTNELVLRSSASGTEWYLDVPGSQLNVEFVNVQDSNASYGTGNTILATDSTDSGNNTNWNFGAEEWNSTDWTLYDLITIKHEAVDETLVDFPVYIDLADLSPQFWSTTPAGATFTGTDIRITTDEDTPQELPRELVFASSTLETGELHFKADRISDVIDTSFRIYYNGNTDGDYADGATYGQYNVWSNGFEAVYHLNENPGPGTAGDITDSTGNGNDGTADATMESNDQVTGPVGSAYDFDGTDDTIALTDIDFASGPLTLSAWFSSNANKFQRILNKGATNPDTVNLAMSSASCTEFNLYDDTAYNSDNCTRDWTDAAWHYLVGVANDTTIVNYTDGIATTSYSHDNSWPTNDHLWYIGSFNDSSEYFNGGIDEVRIASTARSAAWINAEYLNQSTTTNFYFLSGGNGPVGSSTLRDHVATQVNNAFSFQNVTDRELFAFGLTPITGNATITEVTIELRGAKDIDTTDFSNFRVVLDVDADGVYDDGLDIPLINNGVMTLGNEGIRSNDQQGTLVFTEANKLFWDANRLSGATDFLIIADWNAPDNGSSLTFDLQPGGLIATDSNGPHIFLGGTDHIQHNRHNKGGGGGTSAQVGGPPPVGDGDVSGGTNEGGELIGNDPDFYWPTNSNALGQPWSNLPAAYDQVDGTYSFVASPGVTTGFTEYSHGVPGTDSVQGIEVKLEVSAVSPGGTIDVELSWDGGTSFTATGYDVGALTTTDRVVTLGGPSDLWGRAWSVSEFDDANFMVRVTSNPLAGEIVQIDAIQVKIYHQATGGGGGGGGAI